MGSATTRPSGIFARYRPAGRLRDGRSGQFPEVAGRLSARGVLAIATTLEVACSLALPGTASIERSLLYSGVGLAIVSMLTVAASYDLRRRRPDRPRPFRTPGYPLVPAVYLLGTGLLWIGSTRSYHGHQDGVRIRFFPTSTRAEARIPDQTGHRLH
jgi:APA family basic amino acid/polyamine antiporter